MEKSMDEFYTGLINGAVKMLIAMDIVPKAEVAAERMGYTADQLKNLMSGRTPITTERWSHFREQIKQLDSKFTYRWVISKIFPDLEDIRILK